MRYGALLAVLAGLTVSVPTYATDLLTNGGFEAAPVGVPLIINGYASGGMVQNYPAPAVTSQYLSGWTIATPAQSNLQRGTYFYTAYPANAYEGSQFFSLNWSPLGSVVLDNTISQQFSLATASSLHFSAAMATESGYAGSTLQVTIFDAANAIVAQSGLFTNSLGNARWDLKAWDFDLAAGNYTIALRGIGADNAWDVILDDVHLDAVGNAVPEPATWAMMLGGFALTGAALRRRRAKPVAAIA